MRRAMALDPNFSLAHRMLGIVLSHLARHEEALAAARRAREVDPLDFMHQALSAQIAFNARDYPAAVEFGSPGHRARSRVLGELHPACASYEQLGQSDAAFEALQKAGQFSSGNSKSIALRGYLFAKLGRTGEAREVLNTLEAVSRERYVPPYATALVHAGLGEPDVAFEWLERAYKRTMCIWHFCRWTQVGSFAPTRGSSRCSSAAPSTAFISLGPPNPAQLQIDPSSNATD